MTFWDFADKHADMIQNVLGGTGLLIGFVAFFYFMFKNAPRG